MPFRLRNWVKVFQTSSKKWSWKPWGLSVKFDTSDEALAHAVAWAMDRYESEIDSTGVEIVPYEKRRGCPVPLEDLGIYVNVPSGRRVIRSWKSFN
jgi:hypothetical protein